MASPWSQFTRKEKIIFGLLCLPVPSLFYILTLDPVAHKSKAEIRQKEKLEKEKAFVRNFRVEIHEGFLFDSEVIIQRDKPLTDQELELAFKENQTIL